jgi:hypothetical protein
LETMQSTALGRRFRVAASCHQGPADGVRSPMSEKHKLPRVKDGTLRRESNAWTGADRQEKLKLFLVLAIVLIVGVVGAALIVFALVK